MQIDLSAAWQTVRRLVDGFIASLPRFVLAIVIVLFFYVVARVARVLIRRHATRGDDPRTLELAVGRLVQASILLLGALIAFTAAFPSFTPADLVSALGIGGVAIGFAFKDIFQNFLAGILILITKPFRVGDQIIVEKYEGTVEEILTRATYVKTYDGRRVIIPNGDLYTSSVTVNTAFKTRRWDYDIGIGYDDDIDRAREIVLDALREIDGVLPDPKADVIVVRLADSTVNLRARWWTDSHMAEGLLAQDRVLTRVKHDLLAAGISLPFPTRDVILHQQQGDTPANQGDSRSK